METQKLKTKSQEAITSNIDHSVVDCVSDQEKINFLNKKLLSFSSNEMNVDLIVVSEKPESFSSIVDQSKKTSTSMSYVTDEEEILGVVNTIQLLIAQRSSLFQLAGAKNWTDYNSMKSNNCSAVVVCFDVSGKQMWNSDNFDSFKDLNELVVFAQDYGISLNFFNLTESAQKMSLELSIK